MCIRDSSHIAGPCVAEGIRRLRAGQVARRAGFDGEYGEITLLTPAEIEQFSGQISLFGLDSPTPEAPKKRRAAPVPAAEAPEAPQTGPEAVSYTHLDVYKRQTPSTSLEILKM